MSNVQHDVGTCNIKPNQHQVDDLVWQADEHERLAQERQAAREELEREARLAALPQRGPRAWVEAREDAIAGELLALWTRSRVLTGELLRLWAADGTQQEEAPPTLRSPCAGDTLAEAAENAGWSAFACGESYLGSQSEREREAWEDWRSEVGWGEPSAVSAP